MKFFQRKQKGFTVIEMLVVVLIIGILASIVYFNASKARAIARDAERIKTLNDFSAALQLYYVDHKKYPRAGAAPGYGGSSFHRFKYNTTDSNGQCTSTPFGGGTLRFNNSTSEGFLEPLYDEGYTLNHDWNDPLHPSDHASPFNCRYIVPKSESDVDNVQHYLLHCNLEALEDKEADDGGANDTVYEVLSPGTPWVCMCGQDGQGNGTPCP